MSRRSQYVWAVIQRASGDHAVVDGLWQTQQGAVRQAAYLGPQWRVHRMVVSRYVPGLSVFAELARRDRIRGGMKAFTLRIATNKREATASALPLAGGSD